MPVGSPSRVSLSAAAAATLALPALPEQCSCSWDSFRSLLLSPVRCCCCWGRCHGWVSISEVSTGQIELKPISLANVFSHLFCLGSPCQHFPGEERVGLCSAPCCGFCFCCFGSEHSVLLCTSPGLFVCSVLSIPAGRALGRGTVRLGSALTQKAAHGTRLLPWALEQGCLGAGGVLSLHRTLGRNAGIRVAFLGCCELSAVFPGSGRQPEQRVRNCP